MGNKEIIESGFEDDGVIKYEPFLEKDKDNKDKDGIDNWIDQSKKLAEKCWKDRVKREKEEDEMKRKEEMLKSKQKALGHKIDNT